ncbi:MAG: flavodoxin family protein [Solobacterium sp.]|nr:flavodoxin family protein [Solobacterium sp.]
MSRVLLVNGSPHKECCTYTALNVIRETLKEEGIESEIFWLGTKPVSGCTACRSCSKTGECVIDDIVNEFTKKAPEFDGFIFGSPVYYSGMNGTLMSFMDRVFFSSGRKDPHPFRYKPAAAVVSARRAGTTSAIDQINKYFLHQQMPIISSRYWNMVHGNNAEEVLQDEEGLQIMRVLARNMAWFLKLKEAGEKAGVPYPKEEEVRKSTNFIR